jgi:hypothetical protein
MGTVEFSHRISNGYFATSNKLTRKIDKNKHRNSGMFCNRLKEVESFGDDMTAFLIGITMCSS